MFSGLCAFLSRYLTVARSSYFFWGGDGLIWRGMALSTLRVKGYEYFSRVEGFYFLFALASANFVGKGPRLG